MKHKRLWLIVAMFCLVIGTLALKPITRVFALMSFQQLKGTVIILDAGHGGHDPGARISGQDEDEINLQVALKVAELLQQAGAHVEMTREGDVDLADEGVTNNKRSDMEHRAKLLNQPHITLFVSIHCNTSHDSRCIGSQVYFRKGDVHSEQLANCVQDELRSITSSKYIPTSGDFYLFNNTQNLGVLVEIGFLTNSQDFERLTKETYQEELAFGIVEGISEYLSILY